MKLSIPLNLDIDVKIDEGVPYNIKASKTILTEDILKAGPSIDIISDDTPLSNTDHPTTGWQNVPSRDISPFFSLGNIHTYIVEDAAGVNLDATSDNDDEEENQIVNGDCSTVKPLRKAARLVKSGFLSSISDNSDSDYYYISGQVNQSMKTQISLHVVITISRISGAIKRAK